MQVSLTNRLVMRKLGPFSALLRAWDSLIPITTTWTVGYGR